MKYNLSLTEGLAELFNKFSAFISLNIFVSLEVFTAVTMKNGVFWDVMPRGPCKNRRFGGT
jgi:hypothetical protein